MRKRGWNCILKEKNKSGLGAFVIKRSPSLFSLEKCTSDKINDVDRFEQMYFLALLLDVAPKIYCWLPFSYEVCACFTDTCQL
jgi:hypothetical protein